MEKFKNSAKLTEGDQQIIDKKKSYFTSKNGKDWDLAMLVDLIVDRRIKKTAKENSSDTKLIRL